MIRRGEIWWADLDDPDGSDLGFTRPVLVVQNDAINATGLRTVIVLGLSSNLARRRSRHNVFVTARESGLVFVTARESGLPRDSVVVTTTIEAVNADRLRDRVLALPAPLMVAVGRALAEVLDL